MKIAIFLFIVTGVFSLYLGQQGCEFGVCILTSHIILIFSIITGLFASIILFIKKLKLIFVLLTPVIFVLSAIFIFYTLLYFSGYIKNKMCNPVINNPEFSKSVIIIHTKKNCGRVHFYWLDNLLARIYSSEPDFFKSFSFIRMN